MSYCTYRPGQRQIQKDINYISLGNQALIPIGPGTSGFLVHSVCCLPSAALHCTPVALLPSGNAEEAEGTITSKEQHGKHGRFCASQPALPSTVRKLPLLTHSPTRPTQLRDIFMPQAARNLS